MNNNNVLYIVGGIAVLIIIFALVMQGSTPSLPTSTTGVSNTTTNEPSGNAATTGTAGKPVVTTIGFASVSSTTAVLVGTVIPKGAQTTYWFEYGPTPALGLQVNTTTAPASYQKIGIVVDITGLKAATQYYFRAGARNAYGTVFGGPYSFITASK